MRLTQTGMARGKVEGVHIIHANMAEGWQKQVKTWQSRLPEQAIF